MLGCFVQTFPASVILTRIFHGQLLSSQWSAVGAKATESQKERANVENGIRISMTTNASTCFIRTPASKDLGHSEGDARSQWNPIMAYGDQWSKGNVRKVALFYAEFVVKLWQQERTSYQYFNIRQFWIGFKNYK